MATNKIVNPSMFHGLPWELWTNHLGRISPMEDEEEVTARQETKPTAGVMKLPKEDMRLFGVCPERDTFCVVTCELCFASVTPQGLLNHIELRHKYDTQPSAPTLPVEKPPAKVVKSIVKNTNSKVKSKKAVAKENSSKTNKESAASSASSVAPAPNIPVSLPIEASPTTQQESPVAKGESLQPVVALTPLPGPLSPTAPVLSKPPTPHISSPPCLPPLLIAAPTTKPRRPPRADRKCVPIREREYDPDKHCGVLAGGVGVQGKPCTRSLTCKSHSMSLRRAVTGRSKTFDQLLADHRQAKEALLRQKKNLESQTSAVILTPSAQPCPQEKEKPKEKEKEHEVPTIIVSSVPAATVVRTVSSVVTTNATQEVTIRLPVSVSLLSSISSPVISPSPEIPKVSLDISDQRTYLSAIPKAVVLKPHQNADKQTTLVSGACKLPAQLDIAYVNHHPKALGMCAFSSNKIGGLVYTNRRMQVARQGLEGALIDEGYKAPLFLNRGNLGNGLYTRELYSNLTIPGNATATLSNVLNNVTTKALFQRKGNKRIKLQEKVNNNNNKKTVFGIGKVTSLLNTPVSLKSVLPQTYTVSTIAPSAGNASIKNGQFHIPNIITSTPLKRPTDTSPKTQAKKFKKSKMQTLSTNAQLNTAQIIGSLLSGHAKNGLPANRNNVPLVRVAIANGRLDGDSKAVYSTNLVSELSKTAATLADTATTNIAAKVSGPVIS